MGPLLPFLLVASLTLPPALSQSTYWWYNDVIGPGCVEGTMYYPGVPTDVQDECPSVDPPEPWIITNMHDCSSYFLCDEGTATLECCPAGTLWDPPMRICDTPPHVECGIRPLLPYPDTTTTTTTTTTPETTTTTTPETTTTTTPETTTTTTPETTTTTTPETTTTTTPETTTTTTPETTTTTTPEATTTTTPETITTTTPETTTTPRPPIDSKCDDVPEYDGRLPVEGECISYYDCSFSGEDKLVSCTIGDFGQMVYNPTSQACDNQWHYPCDDHINHPHEIYFGFH